MPTLSFPCTSVPLGADDFNSALSAMGIDAATAWTILNVESGKAGYLPDRRPQILFESHQFHNQTNGAYDASNPAVSQPTWIRDYAGGAGEYTRLAQAYALDSDAALKSASWGLGQIMGFNYAKAGYDNPSDFVQDACASEAMQLKQFQNFLTNTGILAPLQAHQWTTVATKYNGTGQVAYYAGKLTDSYNALQNPSQLPDLNVRAAQLYLRFLSVTTGTASMNPANIDGIWGPRTAAAVNAFLASQGNPNIITWDPSVLAALAAALPAAANLDIS